LSHGGELAGFRAAQWEGGDFVGSAPTEKNRRLPAMIRGPGCFAPASWMAAVSARTQARVRRFVPSGDVRRTILAAL
jgi:hypothetical protein